MSYQAMGIKKLAQAIKEQSVKCEEVVTYFLKRIEATKHWNAVIEVFPEVIEQAKEIDKKIANKEPVPNYAGIPILIKDNILMSGKIASAGSKFLSKFVSPYTSTVIEKLKSEGFLFLGRTNMDEFAMGSTNESSFYGPCLNALGDDLVPGGSSGGSATAVAGDLCMAALGSDTGGSVRQPASFQGIVGVKPTYGRVSRYGVIAFASSLEQVGVLSKTVEDAAIVLGVISGQDANDGTTLQIDVPNMIPSIKSDLRGVKVGVFEEVLKEIDQMQHASTYHKVFEVLKEQGAQFVTLSFPKLSVCPSVYYAISSAEAASNFGRFDGVKYTLRSQKAKNIDEIYTLSRSEGFGKEVKRRIMLGNLVLSTDYYEKYFVKAKKLQRVLSMHLASAFQSCDVVVLPSSLYEAPKLGQKETDPVKRWSEDVFTTLANITGVPAISIPCGKGKQGLPLGLQILAQKTEETKLLQVTSAMEACLKGVNV